MTQTATLPDLHQPLALAKPNKVTRAEALKRWPYLVAHVICTSLGYATPLCAAQIVADAKNGDENWCEWIFSCYNKDPLKAVKHTIMARHCHHGYMSEFKNAIVLVRAELKGIYPHNSLASWF